MQKALATDGFISFPPVADSIVQAVSERLAQRGFSPIPPDYADFLKLTDGLYFDGLEFLGAVAHPRPAKNYIFPDMSEINGGFVEYEFFQNCLIIGRISECFIAYDGGKNAFVLIDRINLCSQAEYSTFNDLLAAMLRLCNITV